MEFRTKYTFKVLIMYATRFFHCHSIITAEDIEFFFMKTDANTVRKKERMMQKGGLIKCLTMEIV